jgi:oxygen-independent coproporphyrinogen-3 oxidase
MRREPFALYVHIPFCSRKCPYCDFTTYAVEGAPEASYGTALRKELAHYAGDARFAGREISTIFFGGGTPSLFSPATIGGVISDAAKFFSLASDAEITMEANPCGVTPETLAGYRAAGINRISFGVQSFNEETLRLLGREHTPEQARASVHLAVAAGITNVSVDCIFGVSGQTLSDLQRDLDEAFSLPISHLSTYALSIEPGTPFFQRQERGLLTLPPEEVVVEMMHEIPRRAEQYGFTWYEISNYAKPACMSRHNSSYWDGVDYLGIGAGAHSYVLTSTEPGAQRAVRWTTLAQPTLYAQAVGTPASISWREELDTEGLHFEFFYLGLRRMRGVSLDEFREQFGTEALASYEGVLSELVKEGYLEHTGSTVRLTERGIVVSDSVYERLA